MRNLFSKYIPFAIFFLGTTSVFGQTKKQKKMDYLITNENDTIYGHFKKAFMGDLHFDDEDGGSVYVDPHSIKAYYSYSERKVYQRVITPQKTYWFNQIVAGRIELYEQTEDKQQGNGQLMTVRRWIARKDNGPIQLIKSSGMEDISGQGLKNLMNMISDDQKLFDYVSNMRTFSFANVKLIVETYNQEKPILPKTENAK